MPAPQTLMADPESQAAGPSRFKRWLPIGLLAILALTTYLTGLHTYVSLQSIADHRDQLRGFASTHWLMAMALYGASYVAVVALSLPGAALLSITGGFIFGWQLGAPLTAVAATLGSAIVFQVVKSSFGNTLAERAGPAARKLSEGFARNAFNYLLFLRLVPVFPFFVINAVAGLSGVPLGTFIAATAIGIIPGTLAFSYFGTGLDSIIDAQMKLYQQCVAAKGAPNCSLELDATGLLTPQIIVSFIVLGLVALLPIGAKFWKRRG